MGNDLDAFRDKQRLLRITPGAELRLGQTNIGRKFLPAQVA